MWRLYRKGQAALHGRRQSNLRSAAGRLVYENRQAAPAYGMATLALAMFSKAQASRVSMAD